MNNLLEKINNSDITPIVILEPILDVNFQYGIQYIEDSINSKIIDLTHYKTERESWADESHFNVDGRAKYSQSLVDILLKTGDYH